MSVHIITITPVGDGWAVTSERSLYERFGARREAVRHADALARAMRVAGEEPVIRIREPKLRRATVAGPERASA